MTVNMTRRAVAFLAAAILAAGLTGCGGGGGSASGSGSGGSSTGSSATLVGAIIDAPVQGLAYSASPSGLTGTTDAQGAFKFKAGDVVSFSAAGVALGSVTPQLSSDGSAVVTPLSLTGETGASTPKALAIARFLNTLNSISVGKGTGVSGAFVVPTDAGLASKLAALGQSAQGITAALLQGAIDAAFGTGTYTVTSDADSQSGLNQGIASVGFAGTVWRAVCPGCGGTVYIKPNGEVAGFTDDGSLLSGSWSVAGSSINVNLVSSGGGFATGSWAVGSSSGTLTLNRGAEGLVTLTATKVAAASALATSYIGLWYGTFTPNATGVANTFEGGSAYLLAAPDGKIYGLDDGGTAFSGSWSASSGTGTAAITTDNMGPATISFDFSSGTGALLLAGASQGPIALSRSGVLNVFKSANNNTIPLLLSLVVNWANKPTSASSFALDVHVDDRTGGRISSTVKTMSTALRTDGKKTTNTDNISVSYGKGTGSSYRVTFGDGSTGKDGCSISGGSGTVVDASSGNASAYPTVTVNCN